MNITAVLHLGGHAFNNTTECAEFFGVPEGYICRMVLSDNYPGCTYEFTTDDGVVSTTYLQTSFLQTLSVMKSSDTC